MKSPSLTLGIEEEYQIIDPVTGELRSYITEILKGDHLVLEEVKPELHQSMVEVGSKVCRSPADLRAELVRLRGAVIDLAARGGLQVAAETLSCSLPRTTGCASSATCQSRTVPSAERLRSRRPS